jgi:hypothetical protein
MRFVAAQVVVACGFFNGLVVRIILVWGQCGLSVLERIG